VGAGALLVATAWLAGATAAAETALARRPSDRLEPEVAARFTALAGEVGWGSLFKTEQMARADTAYGAGPVLAVTATPYLPLLFFLESRAWASQRFLSMDEADRRFTETYVDPEEGLLFDLLVIAETPEAVAADALAVRFVAQDGAPLPADLVDHAVTLEPTLGGELFAARARARVRFTVPPDWAGLGGMGLRVAAADAVFELDWRFAAAE